MKVSKKGIYALRALKQIMDNRGKGPLSAARMAERGGLQLKYLEQVLAELRKSGFLTSIRGKSGGYQLRMKPEEITLGSVIRAIDGPLAPIDCASQGVPQLCHGCPEPYESCWIRLLMLRVRDKIAEVMDSETVGDIA